MRIIAACYAVVSALVIHLCLPMGNAKGEASSPNIVFLLADDLGWNDVSWHNDQVVSPHMQSLVNTGVMLEQSYVQPVCTPSRSAFLTGFYPYKLGRQGKPISNSRPTGLTLNHTLLPERLSHLGYATHMIGKWHLGFCDWAYTPTYRGFDTFYGFYSGRQYHYNHTVDDGYDFRDQTKEDFEAIGTYATALHTDRAVQIIEGHKGNDQPFFLYLAFQNVHTPLEVPDEYLEQYPDDIPRDRRLLLGMVTALDEAVGRVVNALKDNGLYDNTVIIFSSDNGGVGYGGESNYPLRGNKGSVWEGGTRAVGFVHSPLLQGTPRVHSGLIHITDWYNTFLTIAGATHLPANDGFNQWDAIRDPGVASERNTFIYNLNNESDTGTLGAIRLESHKFVIGETINRQTEDGPWLFNLEEDPNEEVNLVDLEPELALALEALLMEQLSDLVPIDQPDKVDEANPSNFGGVWTPGWCTAK